MGEARVPGQGRLLSVDFLRGLTIAFMILVNNNGNREAAYWPLKHADWNGFTPTDLVFPTFLFLVGIAVVLSTDSRLARGASRSSLLTHACRRSVLLYVVGLAIHLYPLFDLHSVRFYGVLPRIAVCYFIGSSLYILRPGWRTSATIAGVSLLGYWILMRFVPVPGFGVPTHGITLLDPDRNIVAWLDRKLFSSSHLYERTRDPEGLLSTIPAVATILIGQICGQWIQSKRPFATRIRGVASAGFVFLLIGVIWNVWFPINKKLWTSSFVLFAGGISLLLLALSMGLIDGAKPTTGLIGGRRSNRIYVSAMLVFGTNAIAAYAFSELLASTIAHLSIGGVNSVKLLINEAILKLVPDAPFASLLYSLCFVFVCWLAMYALYRRKIFVKL